MRKSKLIILVSVVLSVLSIGAAIAVTSRAAAIASYQYKEYLYFARYYQEAHDGILRVRQDGTGLECVFDDKWQSFKVFQDKLYVLAFEGLYRINPDGSSKKLILPRTFLGGGVSLSIYNGARPCYYGSSIYIYVVSEDKAGFAVFNTETEIFSTMLLWEIGDIVGPTIYVADGKVIYCKHENLRFYAYDLKSQTEQVISSGFDRVDEVSNPFYFTGKWIIYRMTGSYQGSYYKNALFALNLSGGVYRIKTDDDSTHYLSYNSKGYTYYDKSEGKVYFTTHPKKQGREILAVEPLMLYLYKESLVYYIKDSPSNSQGTGRYFLMNISSGVQVEIMNSDYRRDGIMAVISPMYGMD